MVIGASRDRAKYGNKAVRAFLRRGATVLAVNPSVAASGGEIEGAPCYGSIADVPGPIDRATVYLHAAAGVEAVRELTKRGDVAEVWLNPGADEPEVVAAARAAGLNVIRACSIIAVGEDPHAM